MQKLAQEISRILDEGIVDEARVKRLQQLVRSHTHRINQAYQFINELPPGRYMCHRDEKHGFVCMLLVWKAGEVTAIHDHGIWGVEAILKDSLEFTSFTTCQKNPKPINTVVLSEGAVVYNLPPEADVHQVSHKGDGLAISMHIYGKELCDNKTFTPGEGYKTCKLELSDICERFQDDASVVGSTQEYPPYLKSV